MRDEGEPRELLVLGESVAAGYLHAPALTPSIALQHVLDVAGTPGAVNVVDLARVDDTLPGIVGVLERWRTAHPSRRPAGVVVIAGNNWRSRHLPAWSPRYPRSGQHAEIAGLLTAGANAVTYEGLVRHVERLGAIEAATGLAALAAVADGAPVLVVVPPVDLATWEQRQPTPWLPDDGVARWYAALERGLTALATEDLRGAVRAAALMDAQGDHPVPHHLLARVRRAQGRHGEARQAAVRALDADAYPLMATLSAPRATSLDVAVLCDAAGQHGFDVLDLPALLATEDGGESEAAGPRHLLDYCHLTARGIHLAAAGIAAWALRILGRPGGGAAHDVGRLAAVAPVEVAAADHATALIGAAVHRAHRHLPVSVGSAAPTKQADLAAWLRRAIAVDPGALSAIKDLVAIRRDVVPAEVSAAGLRNAGSAHSLSPAHGLRWSHADADLADAAIDVLGLDPTLALVEDAASRAVDLLADRRHLWEPLAQPLEDHTELPDVARRGWLEVLWPSLDLHISVRRPAPVGLTLTARLADQPWSYQPSRLRVLVNAREVGTAALGRRWSRHVVRLPTECLLPGANRVRLVWPMIAHAGSEPLARATATLATGLPASLHPVFGQLLAATARPARG